MKREEIDQWPTRIGQVISISVGANQYTVTVKIHGRSKSFTTTVGPEEMIRKDIRLEDWVVVSMNEARIKRVLLSERPEKKNGQWTNAARADCERFLQDVGVPFEEFMPLEKLRKTAYLCDPEFASKVWGKKR